MSAGDVSGWFARRRAERRKRHAANIAFGDFLLAKEADYRRGHGMPVPNYLDKPPERNRAEQP